jgi:hypothetical protein
MSPGEEQGAEFDESHGKIVTDAIAQPAFRTTVSIGELTVTGVLPCRSQLPDTAQMPVGSIAIGGDVRHLSCDHALELVDALLLVVLRMDGVAEEHDSARTSANRNRETERCTPSRYPHRHHRAERG